MATTEIICPITNGQSQVKACLEAIEMEYVASQRALYGFTATARHAYITARLENLGTHIHQLTELCSNEEEAMKLVIDHLNQLPLVEECHA